MSTNSSTPAKVVALIVTLITTITVFSPMTLAVGSVQLYTILPYEVENSVIVLPPRQLRLSSIVELSGYNNSLLKGSGSTIIAGPGYVGLTLRGFKNTSIEGLHIIVENETFLLIQVTGSSGVIIRDVNLGVTSEYISARVLIVVDDSSDIMIENLTIDNSLESEIILTAVEGVKMRNASMPSTSLTAASSPGFTLDRTVLQSLQFRGLIYAELVSSTISGVSSAGLGYLAVKGSKIGSMLLYGLKPGDMLPFPPFFAVVDGTVVIRRIYLRDTELLLVTNSSVGSIAGMNVKNTVISGSRAGLISISSADRVGVYSSQAGAIRIDSWNVELYNLTIASNTSHIASSALLVLHTNLSNAILEDVEIEGPAGVGLSLEGSFKEPAHIYIANLEVANVERAVQLKDFSGTLEIIGSAFNNVSTLLYMASNTQWGTDVLLAGSTVHQPTGSVLPLIVVRPLKANLTMLYNVFHLTGSETISIEGVEGEGSPILQVWAAGNAFWADDDSALSWATVKPQGVRVHLVVNGSWGQCSGNYYSWNSVLEPSLLGVQDPHPSDDPEHPGYGGCCVAGLMYRSGLGSLSEVLGFSPGLILYHTGAGGIAELQLGQEGDVVVHFNWSSPLELGLPSVKAGEAYLKDIAVEGTGTLEYTLYLIPQSSSRTLVLEGRVEVDTQPPSATIMVSKDGQAVGGSLYSSRGYVVSYSEYYIPGWRGNITVAGSVRDEGLIGCTSLFTLTPPTGSETLSLDSLLGRGEMSCPTSSNKTAISVSVEYPIARPWNPAVLLSRDLQGNPLLVFMVFKKHKYGAPPTSIEVQPKVSAPQNVTPPIPLETTTPVKSNRTAGVNPPRQERPVGGVGVLLLSGVLGVVALVLVVKGYRGRLLSRGRYTL